MYVVAMTTSPRPAAERAFVEDELQEPFTLGRKIRLGVEIINAYIRTRIWLLRMDLPAVVATTG